MVKHNLLLSQYATKRVYCKHSLDSVDNHTDHLQRLTTV